MPLPTKSNGEKRKDFMTRCMSDSVTKKEFPDGKQRAAVCYSQYDKKKKKN
tara:strand:- start:553 stop:705 length:153 start_codon:yes stop_codon:yes gene_type:complete